VSYDVTIVGQDGTETPVKAKPEKLVVAQGKEGLCVLLTWCKKELADDPEGLVALVGSWPGRESVKLTAKDSEGGGEQPEQPTQQPPADGGEGEPLFTGQVTVVSPVGPLVFIKAAEGEGGDEPEPPEGEMELAVGPDEADPEGLTASITVDNGDQGEVEIDFGDGSPTEVNPGDGTTATTHPYVEGAYTVTATDTDAPERTATADITVPFDGGGEEPGGELTLTVEPGEDPMTASITVDNGDQGEVEIDFGDGSPTEINPGDGATATTHSYELEGAYTVGAIDTDAPERTASQDVQVPFSA